MIIGFTGNMGSGKNLAAEISKIRFQDLGYSPDKIYVKAFGDFVKDTLSSLFKIPREHFDTRSGKKLKTGIFYAGENLSIRKLMQVFGTNGCRVGVTQDFWVIAMKRWWAELVSPDSVLLIPDCRFSNEARFCNAVFKINRKTNFNEWIYTFDLHGYCPLDMFNDQLMDFTEFRHRLTGINLSLNSSELREFIDETTHSSETLQFKPFCEIENTSMENLTKEIHDGITQAINAI